MRDRPTRHQGGVRATRTACDWKWIGWIAASFIVALTPLRGESQNIETVAGGGPVDLPILSAGLGGPVSVTFDRSGNLYVAENHYVGRVYKISPLGRMTNVAGLGAPGYSGDGGPAIHASLYGPSDVAVDAAGNLFISDSGNRVVRRVDASTGIITTVAGNGLNGFGGDGGPATSAWLASASGIALDGAGNLYVADTLNFRVRRVDAFTGIITTVAGNGSEWESGDGGQATDAAVVPTDVALDADGNLFVGGDSSIRRVDATTGIITTIAGNGTPGFSGDGGPATSARFTSSFFITIDADGNLFISDYNDRRVRRVDSETGIITTVAGNGIAGYGGDGGPATNAALAGPSGIALDAAGNLYLADTHNRRVRRVDAATGIIATFAGNGTSVFSDDGVRAAEANVSYPTGVAVDATGNLFIVEQLGSRVRRVDAATGAITTVAGSGDLSGSRGDGGPATSATFTYLFAVASDSAGNLFLSDSSLVRRVDATTGVITTVAGVVNSGTTLDGGPATMTFIGSPSGIALDAAGNLYIAAPETGRIRRVDAITGIITTVAGNGSGVFSGDGGPATSAGLVGATGVTLDDAGNLYIADLYDHRIRRVDATTGIVTTLAGSGASGFSGDGGPATNASLASPHSVAVDRSGDLFIADLENRRVRRVDSETGIITTVAGNGVAAFGGDGGVATRAALWEPTGIALNARGDLFIADWQTQRVRRVVPEPGLAVSLGTGLGVLLSMSNRRRRGRPRIARASLRDHPKGWPQAGVSK